MRFSFPVIAVVIALVSSCSSQKQTVAETSAQMRTPYIFRQVPLKENTLPQGNDYAAYLKTHSDGPVIPGLYQGAVPQGLAYNSTENLLYISNYMFNGKPSSLSVLSMKTGMFIKVLWLQNPDGTPHTGHVGGVTVSKKHLWIASGKGVYRTTLSAVDSAANDTPLKMEEFIHTAAKGSFAAASQGVLWVGEFTDKGGSYSTPDSHHLTTPSGQVHHAWMAGYILDPETDTIQSKNIMGGQVYPDYIISIPDEVQGAAFSGNALIFSMSYGRRNKSRLISYKNPLPDGFTQHLNPGNGTAIPLAVLTENEKIHSITAPPMTEGVTVYAHSIAILFESGSDKYRSTALSPQGRIQLLPAEIFQTS